MENAIIAHLVKFAQVMYNVGISTEILANKYMYITFV